MGHTQRVNRHRAMSPWDDTGPCTSLSCTRVIASPFEVCPYAGGGGVHSEAAAASAAIAAMRAGERSPCPEPQPQAKAAACPMCASCPTCPSSGAQVPAVGLGLLHVDDATSAAAIDLGLRHATDTPLVMLTFGNKAVRLVSLKPH